MTVNHWVAGSNPARGAISLVSFSPIWRQIPTLLGHVHDHLFLFPRYGVRFRRSSVTYKGTLPRRAEIFLVSRKNKRRDPSASLGLSKDLSFIYAVSSAKSDDRSQSSIPPETKNGA